MNTPIAITRLPDSRPAVDAEVIKLEMERIDQQIREGRAARQSVVDLARRRQDLRDMLDRAIEDMAS